MTQKLQRGKIKHNYNTYEKKRTPEMKNGKMRFA